MQYSCYLTAVRSGHVSPIIHLNSICHSLAESISIVYEWNNTHRIGEYHVLNIDACLRFRVPLSKHVSKRFLFALSYFRLLLRYQLCSVQLIFNCIMVLTSQSLLWVLLDFCTAQFPRDSADSHRKLRLYFFSFCATIALLLLLLYLTVVLCLLANGSILLLSQSLPQVISNCLGPASQPALRGSALCRGPLRTDRYRWRLKRDRS